MVECIETTVSMNPSEHFEVKLDNLKNETLSKTLGLYLRNFGFTSKECYEQNTEDTGFKPPYPIGNFRMNECIYKRLIENWDNATEEDFEKAEKIWEEKYHAKEFEFFTSPLFPSNLDRRKSREPVPVIHYDGTPFKVKVWEFEEDLGIMQPPLIWRDVVTHERLICPLITSRCKESMISSCDDGGMYTEEEIKVIRKITDQANKKLGHYEGFSRVGVSLEGIDARQYSYHRTDPKPESQVIPYPSSGGFPNCLYLVFQTDPLNESKKLGIEFNEYLRNIGNENVTRYLDLFKGTIQAIRNYVEDRETALNQIARGYLDNFVE